MELLKQKDYQEYINKKDYHSIRDDILKKTLEFVNIILKEKKINLDDYDYYADMYERICHIFYKEIDLCYDLYYLVKWLVIEYEPDKIDKEDVSRWIRIYNETVGEYNDYLKAKKEIEEVGADKIFKEYKDKIILLCKEMLDYKNKPYEDNYTLAKFLDKIKQYYGYHTNDIYNLRNALAGFTEGANIEEDNKTLNNPERLIAIRSIYNYIKNSYKSHAFLYLDFDLEENETFSDLHIKMLQEKYDLYREMLDYINVEYKENEIPASLENKVIENYPYYKKLIKDEDHEWYNPYPASLTRLRETIDIMRNGYKNHDEDLKNYNEKKETIKFSYMNDINKINKLLRYRHQMNRDEKRRPTIEEEAYYLSTIPEEIVRLNDLIKMGDKFHLQSTIEFADYITSDELDIKDNKEYEEILRKINENIGLLTDREKSIIEDRFGISDNKFYKISEIALKYEINEERVRQIISKSLHIIKNGKRPPKLSDYIGC